MTVKQMITAADLRAEIARHKLGHKDIAMRIPVHVKHLYAVLNEGKPMTPRMAGNIDRAIQDILAERERAA